ncbi:ABC transporter ATP-binding protein, partial [Verrucomicrobiota bacterium]
MSEVGDNSTAAIYRRFVAYIKPYRMRLAVGVLAGLVSGGSIYGVLQATEDVFAPWEPAVAAGEESGTDTPAEEGTVADWLAGKAGIESTTDDGRMTWQFMMLSVIAIPVLMLVRALMIYINRLCMRWIGARVVRDLRDELFRSLQSQSLKFFGKCDIGQLISKCTNDTTVVEQVVSATIAAVTIAPIEILVATVFVIVQAVVHGMVGLLAAVFVVFPVCIIPIIVLGRLVKRHTRRALGRISGLVSRMHENFTGIRIVKAFNTEEYETKRFEEINKDYFVSVIKALKAELLMTPMMEAVAVVLGIVFLVACYARGIRFSQIAPIGFAAIFVYRPLKHVAQINANLQRGGAALQRIFDVIDTDTSIEERADAVPVDGFADGIVFDHVSFCYEENAPGVVKDVSFELRAGSIVALVGETGSGKTTIANLLARFYDPTDGRIAMDGRDLRDIEIASLRRMIGVVTQETILFNDTIADNISYGSAGATREQVEGAARKANAHEFIVADPAGY